MVLLTSTFLVLTQAGNQNTTGTSAGLTGTPSITVNAVTSAHINNTGVITATSFVGDGSALTGIDATSIKDSGGNVKVQANPNGANVTGVLTATSFSGDGSGLTGVASTDNISTNTVANFLSGITVAGVATAN